MKALKVLISFVLLIIGGTIAYFNNSDHSSKTSVNRNETNQNQAISNIADYVGFYKNSELQLRVKVGLKGEHLLVQVGEQQAITLIAINDSEYVARNSDIRINFNKQNSQLVFRQGVTKSILNKE